MEKKLKADTSKTIDEEEFLKCRVEMTDLWGWVVQISHSIESKMSKKDIVQALAERMANEALYPFSKLH